MCRPSATLGTGHAQQWGSVKPKKTKKETPAVSDATPVAAASIAPVRGAFGDRGGRGGARGGLGELIVLFWLSRSFFDHCSSPSCFLLVPDD